MAQAPRRALREECRPSLQSHVPSLRPSALKSARRWPRCAVAAGAAFRVFGSADVHVKGKRLTRDARDLRASPYGAYAVLSPFRFAVLAFSHICMRALTHGAHHDALAPPLAVRTILHAPACTPRVPNSNLHPRFCFLGRPSSTDHSLLVMLLVLLVDVVAMRCTAAVRQCRTRPTCRKHIKSA